MVTGHGWTSIGGEVATDPIAEIRQQNLEVYRVAPGRLREDVSQEAQVAHDYRGRLAYELLQNADDAMESSDAERDRIAFHVTDRELWVANTGRPFTVADVEGLCGLGASSKVDATGTRRASIGHKGLGFKSVLEITDAPTAYSLTYSFQLGEQHAYDVVGPLFASLGRTRPKRLPAMRFPAEVPEEPTAWIRFREAGFNTAFAFPFASRMETAQRQRLARLLLELPVTTVVFLKHLQEVSVTVDQAGRNESRTWRTTRRRRDPAGVSKPVDGLRESGLYEVEVVGSDQPHVHFLLAHEDSVRIGPHRDGLSGPAWEGVELSEVSAAVLDPARHVEAMPDAWRRFHVFLPTAEPCPYPILINGAFTTDLSRQRVRTDRRGHDYNSHLIRQAAGLFRRELAPPLARSGPERLLAALDRGDAADETDSAGSLLHDALTDAMEDFAFMPSGQDVRTLPQTIVPPVEIGEDGRSFRHVLGDAAEVDGLRLPEARLCTQPLARIASDHGATRLSGPHAMALLAREADPERSRLVDHDSGGFALDPVVELASSLWSNAEPPVRSVLEGLAKQLPLFPVHADEDRSVRRVALHERFAFYPPQSARQDLPLSGLAFMLHDICWGALLPNERKALLDDRMTVWRALFDVSEFRFEEVMRASVLPGLVLNPEGSALELRAQLKNMSTLAAICQLAGKQPKPDRPLRFQRLQSDRAIFNLSRLPVPCRSADGVTVWVPAYRVYFGRDWTPSGSVEDLLEALGTHGSSDLDLPLLAPPEEFLGLLEDFADVAPDDVEHSAEGEAEEEVGLDEDLDQPVETDETARWMAFLSWLGVNQCLRPVHFHDVEDPAVGWLTTKELVQPQGWAFAALGQTWHDYRAYLTQRIERLPAADATVAYLYECHDLEALGRLVDAAEKDASTTVGRALLRHLAIHWETYSRFSSCQLALVADGKWPSARSKPQRALPEEKQHVGDNLWLFRLRNSEFAPTTHGPRRPAVTWLPSPEVDRRFGRRGRTAGDVLPLVEVETDMDARTLRTVADRLGIRPDLSPSTFRVDDAAALATRLAELYAPQDRPIDSSALRRVIKPTYRELFELLSGTKEGTGALGAVPMLAETPTGFRFEPARSILYARSPGTKERSGVGGRISTFVLEAEPAATAQLTNVFAMKTLEDALEWEPSPGDPALSDGELEEFRGELRRLIPILLARLRVERPSSAIDDRAGLRAFIEAVEPVTHLAVACRLDGQVITQREERPYFVSTLTRDRPLQAFLVWDGVPWPPGPDEQQSLAMGIADALGVNLVETFLAFIDSTDDRRNRLLDLAGASGYLGEIEAELAPDADLADETIETEPEVDKSPAPHAGSREEEPTGATPTPAPASGLGAKRIPLVSFDSLEIAGEIALVRGQPPDGNPDSGKRPTDNGSAPGGEPTKRRAAAGTDLSELDALGMQITMAFELHRLRKLGHRPSLLAEDAAAESSLVVNVSTPAAIRWATGASVPVKQAFEWLRSQGVSELYPGFDILTLADGRVDRLIELKSSGVDARVQAMSWNEWKSARSAELRDYFWLYLVGNLRSDLPATPFVRAVQDPFGSLMGEESEERATRRVVQLLVREFEEAEEMILGAVAEDR